MLAFSGGRETHVCPFGRVEWMRSKDQGQTWSWPQVLYDGPIDDRDAGIVETPKGNILVTTFTSLAYEPILKRAENAKPGESGAFADPKLVLEWQAVHHRLSPAQRRAELGSYMFRSTDGGVTWSARYEVPLNSPHGPVSLKDGRLLYAGKALWRDDRVGVCESKDDGITWKWLADIATRPGDDSKNYHELHVVEANDGNLVCHIRNHNKPDAGYTLQCESSDGGRTWSVPHSIDVWGLPSHLLRMKDGRLLMTYGHRRKPIGNQLRVSDDSGTSWSEAIALTTDAISGDMGYPSTVECDDGTMVTVWYEVLEGSPLAQLRQARWRWAKA
jgi:sialidase-1